MNRNAPVAEFETTEDVCFRVIVENWSNDKNPTHPAILERYDGSQWNEVDRWDVQEETDTNTIKVKDNEVIVMEAKSKINTKLMFEKDGQVTNVNRRF